MKAWGGVISGWWGCGVFIVFFKLSQLLYVLCHKCVWLQSEKNSWALGKCLVRSAFHSPNAEIPTWEKAQPLFWEPYKPYLWFFFLLLLLKDEKNQVLTTNIWLQMVSWDNSSPCHGCPHCYFRGACVWIPGKGEVPLRKTRPVVPTSTELKPSLWMCGTAFARFSACLHWGESGWPREISKALYVRHVIRGRSAFRRPQTA